MTLRWRLTTAFVLVVLVPLLVGGWMVSHAVPQRVETAQRDSVNASSRLIAQVLRDYCERARATAETAARSVGNAPQGWAVGLVERGLADGLEVFGANGKALFTAGSAPTSPVDCSGPATRSTGYVSAVVTLTTAAGQPAGRAVASFLVDGRLLDNIRSAVRPDDVVLVDTAGSVVAGTRAVSRGVVDRATRTSSPGQGLVSGYAMAASGQPYGVIVLEPRAKGIGIIPNAPWLVLASLVLAIGIAVLSARVLTRPLEQLGEAAARVASGDLNTEIEVSSGDEVGRLASAFNLMTDELRDYVGQLEASRHELESGLSRLGDTLSSTHDLDRILHVVVESAMASTRASGGMVLMLAPGGDELSVVSRIGLDHVPLGARIRVGDGITGRVAQSGDPVVGIIGDGPGELRPSREAPSLPRSMISVPLKSSGSVIGVLNLFGAASGRFGDGDLAIIRTFASQATVAVDNVLLHQEAQRLSITDGLTGLWNYRYFTMSVAKEIERAARFSRPMGLLLIDLDHFKDVNDTYGHQRGDAVLVELAGRLKAEVRDVDTVARYGGEEIVVILPETDVEGLAQLAERVCDAVRRKPFGEPGLPPVHLTVSGGGAVFPHHGLQASTLLARADQALYLAKRSGRDTWRISSDTARSVVLPD